MNSKDHYDQMMYCQSMLAKSTSREEWKSYHHLMRWHRRQIPFADLMAFTIRRHAPKMAANVTKNNSLLNRLLRRFK